MGVFSDFLFKGVPYFLLIAAGYFAKEVLKAILHDPEIWKRISLTRIANLICMIILTACVLSLGFEFRTNDPASIWMVGAGAATALMGSLCATLVAMNTEAQTRKRVEALEKTIHQLLPSASSTQSSSRRRTHPPKEAGPSTRHDQGE